MIDRHDITGLVLAGGRGSRMGGVDKGLQTLQGQALAEWALQRLAPQVGVTALNANRHLDRYEDFGVPVWPDAEADFPGPLAGFLAGLDHAATPWLVTVPCDTPRFPLDLVERLAAACDEAGARAAVAVSEEDGAMRRQPVFCLLHRTLRDGLAAYLGGGGRKIDLWLTQVGAVDVPFSDASAFFNANTLEELRRLEGG